MVELPQIALWCGCGHQTVSPRGICSRCLRRVRLSLEAFGGLRERVLLRDGGRAQCCGALDDIVVHHRQPGRNAFRLMLSMCRRCHTIIHHTLTPGYSFPNYLRDLWRELHPGIAEQLVLPLRRADDVPPLEGAVQPPLFEECRSSDF